MSSKFHDDIAIKVEGVGKCYHAYPNPASRLKQMLLPKRRYYQESWVLKDISFELSRGKALGVIGKNGAGKSTLLQIMTGTLTPTTGRVYMRGSIAALLELGSGFNPEFSGRENVYINGSILGLTRLQISDKFDKILEFSELEAVIDHPVKTYSSGMYIRLAFAVQVCIDPDILIIDEALAVGDVFFQQKCHARMEQLLDQGTSVILVSHDIAAIRKYCDTALLLEDGHNIHYGDVEIAASKYLFKRSGHKKDISDMSQDKEESASPTKSKVELAMVKANRSSEDVFCNEELAAGRLLGNWPEDSEYIDISRNEIIGDKKSARFKSVALCGADGLKRTHFEQGQWAYFFWEVELLRDFQAPIGSLTITSVSNLALYCRSTSQVKDDFKINQSKGSVLRFQNAVKLDLAFGNYLFTVALGEMNSSDYLRRKDMQIQHYAAFSSIVISMPMSGQFSVIESSAGFKCPFFGLVDLPNKYHVFNINR